MAAAIDESAAMNAGWCDEVRHDGTEVGPLDVQKSRLRGPRAGAAMRVTHKAACCYASRFKQILPSRPRRRSLADQRSGLLRRPSFTTAPPSVATTVADSASKLAAAPASASINDLPVYALARTPRRTRPILAQLTGWKPVARTFR